MGQSKLSRIDVFVTVITLIIISFMMTSFLGCVVVYSPKLKCYNNLKGVGTALAAYAYYNNDEFPVAGGDGPWSQKLGWDYDDPKASFDPGDKYEHAPRTLTASWYILTREMDLDPSALVCPAVIGATRFNGDGSSTELIDMWDFGDTPYEHVSYSIQNQYGKYPAHKTSPADNAIAADMSPWFDANGDILPPATGTDSPQLIDPSDLDTWQLGNSRNHNGKGQNVLFNDMHVSFEKTPTVGVDQDNIYTYWTNPDNPTPADKQQGQNPTARDKANDSQAPEDSFLAI
ncbi:hypothetical protein STSP2_03396 [Anaerohalosphaera lusitana]|uniref:Type II secretion system protein n=1 Tax=Anaerohalosphaera lusitana TaxID=1936003 RepID=A0A1U9NQI6_9BACT|nr:hypothetical protein [Anaerohalosphaera lusitana]AQT70191.1 hypothetical protein STSP2_03396 [Anaerohalosphaera lusitana]